MLSLSKRWSSLINILNDKCDHMPVQINEVIIRATVDTAPSSGTSHSTGNTSNGTGSQDAEILEKVLEIIKEKQER